MNIEPTMKAIDRIVTLLREGEIGETVATASLLELVDPSSSSFDDCRACVATEDICIYHQGHEAGISVLAGIITAVLDDPERVISIPGLAAWNAEQAAAEKDATVDMDPIYDRCDPATGHHSTPHRGCILR